MTPLRTVIIGSYTREPSQLRLLYEELALAGCQILSPRSLGFDANSFVRLPGEELLADFDIEMSHLSAIVQSDFIPPSENPGLSSPGMNDTTSTERALALA
jgi:hypothetical protein